MHPLAGKPAPAEMLIDVDRLRAQYYDLRPDPSNPAQRVSFGTSGHRGSSADGSFNEAHILAITQAICECRKRHGITRPLYVGMDSHALSIPAQKTALEVLAAHGVETRYAADGGFTPTPAISHAILSNPGGRYGRADGIVITPSHNPPEDGGLKYNPPHGGPAETWLTDWIEDRANELLRGRNREVQRIPYDRAIISSGLQAFDFVTPYVDQLDSILEMAAIRESGISIGADPLGGASVGYWGPIAERYGLNLTVTNPEVDPTFRFMTLDHDGKIRMDCSSPYAMAGLVALKDRYDIAFGNDTDADRHGIVAPSVGLLNPNHYLAVAISYLFRTRPGWAAEQHGIEVQVGKTLVSSAIIDRVAAEVGRKLYEVPVGFKWFVKELLASALGFAGEESAGASFLRKDGHVWTTDKDGIILNLLAAEIIVRTGKDPGILYRELTERMGNPIYRRIDAPATPEQKALLKKLSPESVEATTLAGEQIISKLTRAPGNDEEIGGLKVVSENGWFAARPSGTEDVYKIYAESFKDEPHLDRIIDEARQIVSTALRT